MSFYGDKTNQDFTTHRGDHNKISFEVSDLSGDISGVDVDFKVTDLEDYSDVILSKSEGDSGVTFDDDDPIIYADVDEGDYSDLTKKYYHYELRIVDGGGNPSVTHTGIMRILNTSNFMGEDTPKKYGRDRNIISRTGTTAEGLGVTEERYNLLIDTLLERASRRIDEFCGRIFYEKKGFSERLEGNYSEVISVTNYPITNINEVKVGNEVLDSSNYMLVDKGEPLRNTGRIRRLDSVWMSDNIVVDYDYGYSDTPSEINYIAEDMVKEIINEANAEVQSDGANNISMDGYSVDWGTYSSEEQLRLIDEYRKRLDKYQRPLIG